MIGALAKYISDPEVRIASRWGRISGLCRRLDDIIKMLERYAAYAKRAPQKPAESGF